MQKFVMRKFSVFLPHLNAALIFTLLTLFQIDSYYYFMCKILKSIIYT